MTGNVKLIVFMVMSALLCVSAVIGQNDYDNSGDDSKSGLIFEAGSTEFKNRTDGTFTKRYFNGVSAWTEDHSADLKSDAAFYDSRLGETRFYGSAAFRDSLRLFNADTLVYYERNDEVVAVGNVRVTEKDRTFWADQVRYEKNHRLVHAIGSVFVRDDSLRSSINGVEAVFNDSTNYGLIIGRPVLVREDAIGSIITITCEDTLEILSEDKIVRLWSNVEVIKDSLKAVSGRAVYHDSTEVVILTGTPEVHHVMYERHGDASSKLRAESYVTGDTIKVYLQERKVKSVDVVGNAFSRTVWTDSTDAVYARSILESAKMRLTMEDDLISMVTAVGTASSYYFWNPPEEETMFVNEATGDTLYFFYKNGRISQLRISGYGGGGAKGKYYEFSPEETSAVTDSVTVDSE